MARNPVRIRYVIDDEAVQSYIRTGGEFDIILTDVIRLAWAEARHIVAPHTRSKRLHNGIKSGMPKMVGPLQSYGFVNSTAKHTTYFMEDTGPKIRATRTRVKGPGRKGKGGTGGFMLVPIGRVPHTNLKFAGAGSQQFAATGRTGVVAKKVVNGYKGTPFLDQALNISLTTHRFK